MVASSAALAAIDGLVADRGPVMFFQSGGCCDGSLPICFLDGEFVLGDRDVLLGHVGGAPFYIDHRQYEVWKHTQLILDVGVGDPEGFSLAAGENEHFVIRSRIFDAEELAAHEEGLRSSLVHEKPLCAEEVAKPEPGPGRWPSR